MQYYSTHKKSAPVNLQYAVLKGLADDGGLYMPERIPVIRPEFYSFLHKRSLPEIAYEVTRAYMGDEIPPNVLRDLVNETVNFPIPLVQVSENIYSLELFHGPTMAFKDVGARFMSRLMSYLLRGEKRPLKVVVATSGDTGSAVAAGFFNVPGIDVSVLFPKGKVSPLQQKQITTWGKNITALEIDGTFDDCQALAKQVLSDEQLNDSFLITSANSINIARLIPQSFYYFWAVAQLNNPVKPVVFSVPSGNFGNLTAGLLAHTMGLKTERFVAATNINDVVPQYYQNGVYNPRASVQTISNAMDVGNPSNFARMLDLLGNDHNLFREKLYACSFTDDQTRDAIYQVLTDSSYMLDPHGAVAWLGAKEYHEKVNPDTPIIMLETAHPSKFPETLPMVLEKEKTLPPQLKQVSEKVEKYHSMENSFEHLKQWMLQSG